ncbi:MAG: UDP-N-acetylglucosamine 2-epimerase (non-hydrolyzing) [Kiritimatiellae bacterium]|nr:UDP-N-acetylglucosamine 2-epimerase (non-hydrolyzing) [Kiritimatiellia bacterium]MDD5523046.1 UDP-N-acetylglucosamine 2-epimerase (non-hydrolyzing) [Kiritimatiellia bacterium]
MKKAVLLVGARPNYMKIAPLWRVMKLESAGFVPVIIHTGQHYDPQMSDIFFDDLAIPQPDVCLDVGSGSHAEQTGKIMIALEPALMGIDPNVLVVVGDVNSTLAGALVAAKMGIPVAHVEAGLRSFDRTMPEEINRMLTDSISSILFTSCKDADKNLKKEGIPPERIHFVGNIMIDSLVKVLRITNTSDVLERMRVEPGKYVCVTIHRPSNVDDMRILKEIILALEDTGRSMPVVFPVHPRTKKMIARLGWKWGSNGLRMVEPLGYVDFMQLMSNAAVVVTDSGGIQEETTYLGIQCLTIRENTERPITIAQGTNRLIKSGHEDIVRELQDALKRIGRPVPQIELWDGKTAERIFEVLKKVI